MMTDNQMMTLVNIEIEEFTDFPQPEPTGEWVDFDTDPFSGASSLEEYEEAMQGMTEWLASLEKEA